MFNIIYKLLVLIIIIILKIKINYLYGSNKLISFNEVSVKNYFQASF